MSNIFYTFLAIFAGIIVTIQAGINSRLGMKINNPEFATLITFIIGSIFLIAYLLILKKPYPTLATLKSVPIWMYLGGLTGAIYVLSVIVSTPQLGVANVTILLLFAQIIASLVIDHFNLFGLGQRTVDVYKIIGVLLVIGGVFLVNKK